MSFYVWVNLLRSAHYNPVHGHYRTREEAEAKKIWIYHRYPNHTEAEITTEWPENGLKWLIYDMPDDDNNLLRQQPEPVS
jgi:hypothetical protein